MNYLVRTCELEQVNRNWESKNRKFTNKSMLIKESLRSVCAHRQKREENENVAQVAMKGQKIYQ